METAKYLTGKSHGKRDKKDFPPVILRPLSPEIFALVQREVAKIRKSLKGALYPDRIFHRHYIHNLPLLVALHEILVPLACETFGEKVKPSYVFLSLYGDQGICPRHVDRPQCKYTIDLCIAQRKPWEIFVEGKGFLLEEGEALCFSGTDQEHWRDPIQKRNFCDLAFFHFVPARFRGSLN